MKNKDLIQQAVKLYEEGLDSTQINNQLGVSKGTIGYWVRKYSNPRHRGPKSKIVYENYFDKIDTEKKAYWLGWIMADGNVSIYNGQYSLKLHISLEDKILIDRFLIDIKSSNRTKIKNGENPSYYVSLTSRHMVESLIRLGVIPQKTAYESLPNIDKHLIPHFIRGYFDGDGITCITDKSKISGFVSSEQLLKSILTEIQQDIKIRKNKNIFYFQSGVKFSKILYKYMYSNATIWLERKRNRMDLICGNTEVNLETKKSKSP